MGALRITQSRRPGSSPRGRAALGLPTSFGFALFVATTTFVACADDGNVIGSAGGGTTAHPGGSSQSGAATEAGSAHGGSAHGGATDAGAAHGGSTTDAGAGQGGSSAGSGHGGSGGTTSSAGSSGTGGVDCNHGECFAPHVCLSECGGEVVYTGCCACSTSAVDQITCGAGGSGAGSGCVGHTCTADQTCVAYRTVGGAVFPPDMNGHCDSGRHLEGSLCQPDFDYTCAALTGCSAPATTCHCAAGSDCVNTSSCSLPSSASWLDADADLVCELQAP
jgi:hypothetical protein